VIPALTFVADANVVRMVGAPVLADCASLEDWNMSAATIERRLTEAHQGRDDPPLRQYPCDMAPIVRLCRERVSRWSDVAHARGDDRRTGLRNLRRHLLLLVLQQQEPLGRRSGMVVARDRRLYERLRGCARTA
jgi:dTDP-4-amino-4,6-dideoxygalactose transaminase